MWRLSLDRGMPGAQNPPLSTTWTNVVKLVSRSLAL
jgi:hypothetical protein